MLLLYGYGRSVGKVRWWFNVVVDGGVEGRMRLRFAPLPFNRSLSSLGDGGKGGRKKRLKKKIRPAQLLSFLLLRLLGAFQSYSLAEGPGKPGPSQGSTAHIQLSKCTK